MVHSLVNDSETNIKLLIRLSREAYPNNSILSRITVVQGVLEGGLRSSPPSKLALLFNNLFGIKGHGTGISIKGKVLPYVNLPTHEYFHNNIVEVDQYFAVNACVEDSIQQHKALLEHERYEPVLKAKTFEDACNELKACGYATDPAYPKLLIDLDASLKAKYLY